MRWADEIRELQVRVNADTPEDAKQGRDFGAEGIGLCRTEHMFFKEERIPVVREMIDQKVDTADPNQVWQFAFQIWQRFARRCQSAIHSHYPQATVFFNGNAAWSTPRQMLDIQTHFELEHMPSVWGGYDTLPPRVRRLQKINKPMIAMSGKFHTMWGEFGGYKHPQAMKLEVADAAAHGCGASFGDQLHPTGQINDATYRHIAIAYEHAKRFEPYIDRALPTSDLAFWCPEPQYLRQTKTDRSDPDSLGVAQMLMEAHLEYQIVSHDDSLDHLHTLILPGHRILDEAAAQRIETFLDNGGHVLALGPSPLHVQEDRFVLQVGADWHGHAQYQQDYVVPGHELRLRQPDLVDDPLLCYDAAERCLVTDGQSLAQLYEPYFDRTYAVYCSHLNSPPKPDPSPYTGAVKKDRLIYLPQRLGKSYSQWGAYQHRELFITALRWLYPNPIIETTLPSVARISLLHQPHAHRYLLHMMYAPPVQRGKACVLEDQPVLLDIPVTLRVKQKITGAYWGFDQSSLHLDYQNTCTGLTIPRLQGHTFVTIEYTQDTL